MLSLAASFRAAARRQSSRLSPAAMATRATSSSAPQDPDDMNELAAELEAFGAGQTGEDNIIDPSENPTIVKGYPILKGFVPGQLTQPKNFTRTEYLKGRSWTKRSLLGPDAATSKELDVFHQLNLDPLKECRNTSLLSRFVTSMGKIRGRNETKLTWKNQRRMGKAIRRAKMMGLIPVLSKRPLLLTEKRIS